MAISLPLYDRSAKESLSEPMVSRFGGNLRLGQAIIIMRRYSYELHLDLDIALERARELGSTLDGFHPEVACFLAARVDPS